MVAFIDRHRDQYGVEPICRQLPIAPSTYYEHRARQVDPTRLARRAKRDDELKGDIKRVHATNFGVYGARKVWRQLKCENVVIARCTVERLIRSLALRGVVRGKHCRTTIVDDAAERPLDRVNRQFQASRPNQLWMAAEAHCCFIASPDPVIRIQRLSSTISGTISQTRQRFPSRRTDAAYPTVRSSFCEYL